MNESLLIVGCGYLGRRVAALASERCPWVFATTRGRSRELAGLGLEPVVCDVLDPPSLADLPEVRDVAFCVGHDRSAGRPMREVYVRGLANVLEALPATVRRVVYVSSTSVYGQTGGEVVDESAPTDPAEESGRVVREAEEVLRTMRPDGVVLRFAGIYGPGRLLREQAVRAGQPIPADPEKWLNLIHVADGARAVLAAVERGRPGAVYNVSDGHPVRRREYYAELAAALGAPAPRFEAPPDGDATDRRVGNARMRRELRVELQYPSYIEGLRASVTR
jgi:nucleoside-diphosphate-sugar epimerase